jgi:hypothetical protein
VVEVSSGAKASKVLHVCPEHGAIMFSRVIDYRHKFVLRLTHDGRVVWDIWFLIFGGSVLVCSYAFRVPKKYLPKFDLEKR